MQSTFTVLFYVRRNYVYKNGNVGIMVKISINGKRSQFSSKLEVNPKIWDSNLGSATGKSVAAKQINNLLEQIKHTITNHYRELEYNGQVVTPDQVKSAFLGNNEQNSMLLQVFKEYNEDLKQQVGISTSKTNMQKYSVTYTRLKEFMRSKYNINDIHLAEINYKFIKDFETYLLNVARCNENTTYKFMQRFKRITNLALHSGWIKRDPFVKYKIKTIKVDRGYLTQEELELIMSKEFKVKRLEQVRDIFIFGCFTGLAYIDVSTLTKKHINTSFDGRVWITKKRQKTGTDSNILLLDIPMQILEKYKGYIGNGKGQLLPVSSNQKINAYLKEIADLCGIKKNLTFHLARHTFATTVTLAKGVPIETVSKMLGHTKISTTQIYARITDTKIGDDMQRVADHFDSLGKIMNI